MKFIRDIISEKAGLAGRAGREDTKVDMAVDGFRDRIAEPEPADAFPDDLAGADVDIVHKVASGGQSLSGASDYAFAAEAPAEFETAYKDDTLDPPEMDYAGMVGDGNESDSNSNSGFDDLTDPARAEVLDDGGSDDASELFGDLWPETKRDAPKSDAGRAADGQPQNAEINMSAPASVRESSAPVVRPATRAVLPSVAPEPPAAAPTPEGSSAFQRMVQREKQTPSDKPPRQARPASDMRAETPVDMSAGSPAEASAEIPVEIPKAIKVPAPASGRAGRQMGRVKTRLLGFNTAQDSAPDPFENQQSHELTAASMYPVGWMVVIDGPGRGNAFTLFDGVSQIGRGEGQAIRLDFGDNSISRSNHAAIAYDAEQQGFYLGHGGKANLVRLNGSPVLSTEQLSSGAEIRIGETTLRFVALCGNDFDWGSCQDDDVENAQFG